MFKKKKVKQLEISNPTNFEHRVHTGFDSEQGTFVGLPPQWTGIVQSSPRPMPLVDASQITEMDMTPLKVSSSSYKGFSQVSVYQVIIDQHTVISMASVLVETNTDQY